MADQGTFCFLNATYGFSHVSQTKYRGRGYDYVFYAYTQCPNTASIQQYMCPPKRYLACLCDTKRDTLEALIYAQLSTAVLGIILNFVVLSVYAQRKAIQNNIGNIQLAGQALVDLSNLLLYAIPLGFCSLAIPGIFCYITLEVSWKIAVALFSFSFYTSISNFTFVAFERYMALYKPLWHNQNITRGWIMKRLIIVFCVALFVITPIQTFTFAGTIFIYVWMIIWFVWTAIISVIYALTFIKTYKCLKMNARRQRKNKKYAESNDEAEDEQNGHGNHVNMKILRVTLILLMMYAVFLMTIVPVLVVNALAIVISKDYSIENSINNLLFFVASIVNPLLTLTLKEDFKTCRAVCIRKLTNNAITFKRTRNIALISAMTSSTPTLRRSEQSSV